jgi:hypothetical protein
MPGDIDGYSCSAEVIVSSPSPLDPKNTVSPELIARALEKELRGLRGFRIPGSPGTHAVVEVHVYRVAPTLTSIRAALGAPTPWTRGKKAGKSSKRR